MSENAFIKSTPQIDALVNGATNFEEIRESVKSELERSGVVLRDAHDPYNGRLLRQPERDSSSNSSVNADGQRERIIELANGRRFQLVANTEEELDFLEAGVRKTRS
jgi:hypothetical protein